MKKAKKIISLLLSILMIITALPLTAVNSFAAEEITSGDYTYGHPQIQVLQQYQTVL